MNPITLGVVIVVITALVFVADIPAVVAGGLFSIMGTPISCDNGPYVAHCYCDPGEEKWNRGTNIPGVTEYYCRDVIDDTAFRDNEYANFAISGVNQVFPNCDTYQCTRDENGYTNTLMVVREQSGAYVRVECRGVMQTNQGQVSEKWWEIYLEPSAGNPMPGQGWYISNCISYDGTWYTNA